MYINQENQTAPAKIEKQLRKFKEPETVLFNQSCLAAQNKQSSVLHNVLDAKLRSEIFHTALIPTLLLNVGMVKIPQKTCVLVTLVPHIKTLH